MRQLLQGARQADRGARGVEAIEQELAGGSGLQRLPREEPRAPSMSSMRKPDGSMVSKPLEDLWPFLPREEFLANMIVPLIEE